MLSLLRDWWDDVLDARARAAALDAAAADMNLAVPITHQEVEQIRLLARTLPPATGPYSLEYTVLENILRTSKSLQMRSGAGDSEIGVPITKHEIACLENNITYCLAAARRHGVPDLLDRLYQRLGRAMAVRDAGGVTVWTAAPGQRVTAASDHSTP